LIGAGLNISVGMIVGTTVGATGELGVLAGIVGGCSSGMLQANNETHVRRNSTDGRSFFIQSARRTS
jgi:hypothetical protein